MGLGVNWSWVEEFHPRQLFKPAKPAHEWGDATPPVVCLESNGVELKIFLLSFGQRTPVSSFNQNNSLKLDSGATQQWNNSK